MPWIGYVLGSAVLVQLALRSALEDVQLGHHGHYLNIRQDGIIYLTDLGNIHVLVSAPSIAESADLPPARGADTRQPHHYRLVTRTIASI